MHKVLKKSHNLQKTFHQNQQASYLALSIAIVLTFLKCCAAYYSGSVSVLSEALHSCVDLGAALMTLLSVRKAFEPANSEHPFGYGKLESISSFVESMLLLGTGFFLIYEGLQRWSYPQPIAYAQATMLLFLFSAALNFFVYFRNHWIASHTGSIAIAANAQHFFADFVTSFGVLIGLALIELTGYLFLDAVIGCAMGLIIGFIALRQAKISLKDLTDNALPVDEIQRIYYILKRHKNQYLEMHDLRTRKSGNVRYMDFHLVVCANETVFSSHALCDRVEEDLCKNFDGSSVHIHVEPCQHISFDCLQKCPFK